MTNTCHWSAEARNKLQTHLHIRSKDLRADTQKRVSPHPVSVKLLQSKPALRNCLIEYILVVFHI